MVSLNRDINILSPEDIATLLDVPEPALEALLARRTEGPLESLRDIVDHVDVDATLLQELDEAGLLTFGNPQVTHPLLPLPAPVIANAPPDALSPAIRPSPMTDVLAGLSQLFSGLTGLAAMEPGQDPPGKQKGALPALAEGQHRRLSDARVKLLRPQSGWMHRPPTSPLDPPGPMGFHTVWVEVDPPCYCLYVWILKGRRVAGQEVGASPLAAGAVGNGASLRPAAASVDKVVEDIHRTNLIFAPHGFQFCLCSVRVLDPVAMRSSQGDPTLADTLFTPTGVLYGKDEDDPRKITPDKWLYNGFQYDPALDFKRRCVHIFYVADVQRSPQRPEVGNSRVHGVGGPLETRLRDKRLTPVGIVEGGGDTIAHEIGHGLGLLHPDRNTVKKPRRPGEPQHNSNDTTDMANLMLRAPTGTDLNPYQTAFLHRAIAANALSPGCPGA